MSIDEVVQIPIPFRFGSVQIALMSKILPVEATLLYYPGHKGQGWSDLTVWARRALRPHVADVAIPEMLRLAEVEDAQAANDRLLIMAARDLLLRRQLPEHLIIAVLCESYLHLTWAITEQQQQP